MPAANHPFVHTPGWITLGRKAAEIAGLLVISRLLESPAAARPGVRPAEVPAAQEVPETPSFITEVVDKNARLCRGKTAGGQWLYAAFFTDGRVRLATGDTKRFSGFTIDRKAVMADLHEDVSFEMLVDELSGTGAELTMDGGPFDGQTILCEALS